MTNTTSDKDTAGTTGVTGVTGTAGAAAAASARARILVLGAGGFVGRHVFAGLSGAAGMSAVATTRSGRLPPGAPAGATAIALDAADPTALRAVLATGFDGVVDCT
ncbi:MAG: NAD-dependent epimerase/dehydratase family protein, partial [Pseudomonadota bacterium]